MKKNYFLTLALAVIAAVIRAVSGGDAAFDLVVFAIYVFIGAEAAFCVTVRSAGLRARTLVCLDACFAVLAAAAVISVLTPELYGAARAAVYLIPAAAVSAAIAVITVLLAVKYKGRVFYKMRLSLSLLLPCAVYFAVCMSVGYRIPFCPPEFTFLLFVLFVKGLYASGAFATHAELTEAFAALPAAAGFTDKDFNAILKTGDPAPDADLLREAASSGVRRDGDAVGCVKAGRGYFYWAEDGKELSKLNEMLSETGDYLSEEHAVLSESASIEEARRRTSEQNRLFDGISQSLQPQLNKIEEILNGLPDDEAGFCRDMKYAGVLGAYVKRYSNLLLLAASEGRIDSFELYLCINESFVYLRLLGVSCCADIQQGIELPVSCELLMYELFEAVIEAAPYPQAVFAALKRESDGLMFYVEASDESVVIDKSFFEKAENAGFTLETEASDGCFFAVMRSDEEGMI